MKNFSPLKQRILSHIEAIGMSKKRFYEKTGIPNGSLDKESGVSEMFIEKYISSFPEINADWLLNGKGEMLRVIEDLEQNPKTVKGDGEKSAIPLYELDISAGPMVMYQDHGMHAISSISLPGIEHCDFAMIVYGDSMYPEIRSGDYVAVRRIQDLSILEYGKKYVVVTEEFRMVKYVQKHDDVHYIILRSVNPTYDLIDISKSSILQLFLVEFVIRREG